MCACSAFAAYLSQLLNTALVLLLVNAAPAASASKDGAANVRGGDMQIKCRALPPGKGPLKRANNFCFTMQRSVLKYLMLDGQYTDFSPSWYRGVGLSLLVGHCLGMSAVWSDTSAPGSCLAECMVIHAVMRATPDKGEHSTLMRAVMLLCRCCYSSRWSRLC